MTLRMFTGDLGEITYRITVGRKECLWEAGLNSRLDILQFSKLSKAVAENLLFWIRAESYACLLSCKSYYSQWGVFLGTCGKGCSPRPYWCNYFTLVPCCISATHTSFLEIVCLLLGYCSFPTYYGYDSQAGWCPSLLNLSNGRCLHKCCR